MSQSVKEKSQTKAKKFPKFPSDAEAQKFVAEADLSEYDFSGFRPMSDVLAEESKRKDKTITFRLSKDLLDMLKANAKAQNIPYQRYMRLLLAKGLSD